MHVSEPSSSANGAQQMPPISGYETSADTSFRPDPASGRKPDSTALFNRLSSFYFISVAILFVITGYFKASAAISNNPEVYKPDYVFKFMSRQALFGITAFLEVSCAVWLVYSRAFYPRLAATIWMAGLFSMYRIGLALEPHSTPGACSCFGIDTLFFGLKRETIAHISLASLSYLILGAAVLAAIHRMNGRRVYR